MSIMSNAKRALAIAAAAATLLSMAACGSSNAASGKSDSSGHDNGNRHLGITRSSPPSASGVPWPKTSAAATSKSPTS